MNTDDRELLELAAKAAGIEIAAWSNVQAGGFQSQNSAEGKFWNPLSDDGDALRLAVSLCIGTDHSHPADQFPWVASSDPTLRIYAQLEVGDESGRLAETRRAIVLAAAAIGKAKS
nr:hypothetical protein [uncultured Pseudomonas sp.]